MSPASQQETESAVQEAPCAENHYHMSPVEYAEAVGFTDGWFAACREYAGH